VSDLLPTARLGTTGPTITRIGFGAWAIGGAYEKGWGQVDDGLSVRAILRAADLGISWIDTAPVYGHGHSESVVGRAVSQLPGDDRPLVFTKCGRLLADGEVRSDLRPASIRRQCEDSLRRLSVERIDLYQIHVPDRQTGTPVEESWATLAELADEGKVRWIGVSNFNQELIDRCAAIRPVDSLQPPMNLLDQAAVPLARWCGDRGIGVLAYSPLASGMLTGGFNRARMATLTEDDWRRRSPMFNGEQFSRNIEFVDKLAAIARDHGCSSMELALAWVLAQAGVTAAIVGTRSPDQVDAWVRAANCELPPEIVRQISEIAPVTRLSPGPDRRAEARHPVGGGAEHGLELGVTPGEGGESAVSPDVVDEHHPARRHDRRRLLHFEHGVLGRVQAVVDEQLHGADLSDQRRQPPPAFTLEVGPAGPARVGDRRAGLPVQLVVEGVGQVDAPQMSPVVLRERLEHDTAADPVGHAGLDHGPGPDVPAGTPDRAAQLHVGVAVPTVGMTARLQRLRGQQLGDVREQVLNPLGLRARPRCPEQSVQVLVPVVVEVGLDERWRLVLLPPLAWQGPRHADRIDDEFPENAPGLARGREAADQRRQAHDDPRYSSKVMS
jgi:aryl-alcohol dehydrogenase-like predicted oxidoreductase